MISKVLTIQIVILSRGRPKYLNDTIRSVLSQKLLTTRIEIIISDNSDNSKKSEVKRIIDQYYPDNKLKYIKRNKSMLFSEHFQLVVSECKEKYIVVFHDDDIMHPNYIETMSLFIQREGVAAVGCNSYIFSNDIVEAKPKPHNFNFPKTFNSKKDFLRQLLPGGAWIAPFPGYMYKTALLKMNKISNIPAPSIYSDIDPLMLNALLDYGSIIWVPDFLMYYRLHNSNLSNSLHMPVRIDVLNCMARNGLSKDSVPVIMLRCGYWLKWLLMQNIKNIFLWKGRVVFKYLFFKSFFLVFKTDFWKALFNKHTVSFFFKINKE